MESRLSSLILSADLTSLADFCAFANNRVRKAAWVPREEDRKGSALGAVTSSRGRCGRRGGSCPWPHRPHRRVPSAEPLGAW